MNWGIFAQAEKRAAAAAKKAKNLKFVRSFDEAKDAWSEFLVEHTRTFNRLGNAAESPQERGWFDRLQSKRRSDPLLTYLTQARHVDEHGRDEIVTMIGESISIGASGGYLHIDKMVVSPTGIEIDGFQTKPGHQLQVKFHPRALRALPVVNRGIAYPLPKRFLERDFASDNPGDLAECGVEFAAAEIAQGRRTFARARSTG